MAPLRLSFKLMMAVLEDGRLLVAITDHLPGRHAIGMIRNDLLDAVLWKNSVRLRVQDDPPATIV